MAEKATMIKRDSVIFSLAFDDFLLEFDIDRGLSNSETLARRSRNSADFLFAAGSIWIRRAGRRYLVIDEFNAGNVFQLLRNFQQRLEKLPSLDSVSGFVMPGEWCLWVQKYWKRIEEETVRPEDELNFDLLSHLSFVESRNGRMALYKASANSIIEVSVLKNNGSSEVEVNVMNSFDAGLFLRELVVIDRKLRSLLTIE